MRAFLALLILAGIASVGSTSGDGITQDDVVKTIEHMRAIVQEQTRELNAAKINLDTAQTQLIDATTKAASLQITIDNQTAALDTAEEARDKAVAKYARLKLIFCLVACGVVFGLLCSTGLLKLAFPWGAIGIAAISAGVGIALAFYL